MINKNELPRIGLGELKRSILFIAKLVERGSKIAALAIGCLIGFWPAVGMAQNIKNPQSAVDNLMRGSSHINPATGAMQLQVPLGQYRGRGQASLPITLYYSSRVWDMKYKSGSSCDGTSFRSSFEADYAHGSVSGWTSSLDWFMPKQDVSIETYDVNGNPSQNGNSPLVRVARLYVTLPDGSRHELRGDDKLHSLGEDLPTVYYAVDGSRLRWESATDTLFMPDGSRFVNWLSIVQNPVQTNNSLQYFDRNGNYMSFDGTVSPKGVWTDTLGRKITVPIGGAAPTANSDYVYSQPSVNGTTMKYTLRWRSLGDPGVLTDPSAALRYSGDWNAPICSDVPPQSNNLFSSSGTEKISQGIGKFNPVVLWQIALPNNTNYTFTYNIYGEIDHIVYPTGASESFTYNQLEPLGAQLDTFSYLQASRGVSRRDVAVGTTTQTWKYNSRFIDTLADTSVLGRAVTSPDGATTQTWYYKSRGSDMKYGFDDARTGMAREERVYDSNDNMVRRTLMQLAEDGPQGAGGDSRATRNARVTKQVDIMLDTGDDRALASATDMDYDSDLNVIRTRQYDYVSIAQGDAKSLDVGSIPIPIERLLRTVETDYLTNDTNYRARNLLALPTARRTMDSTGTVLAKSSITYDEQIYTDPMMYSATNWTDPGTARGNATSEGEWLDTSNTYLQRHLKYDRFGNVRMTKDVKGNESTFDYSVDNKYAYATTMTSAIPDPSGNSGSTTAFMSTTAYDFNTGLVTSTTDANNQVTTFGFADVGAPAGVDPLNRVTKVTRPDGGVTTFTYNDVGSLFVETLTKQDSQHYIDAYQFFDGLGRPTRSFLGVGADGNTLRFNTIDMQYDSMGRVSRVSNPYVSSGSESAINPLGNWTTTVYDTLGRVVTVTSPDNATVTTVYGGSTKVTLGATAVVIDQAGKSRRGLTDALGRLVRVDEPDSAGTIGDVKTPTQATSYAYDVLGNLSAVTQDQQHRYFMYDSLSRLIRTKSPEHDINASLEPKTDPVSNNSQWSLSYVYDNNGNLVQKVDARNVTTTYNYDALNRLTKRSYSDSSPAVSYGYDVAPVPVANPKGRLTKVSSSVSIYEYTGYDELGRVLGAAQTTGDTRYPMSYGYNLAGAMISETYPSGKVVATEYDVAGRISGVKNQASTNYYAGGSPDASNSTYDSRIQYAAHGAVETLRLGNGSWEHSNFNPRLQPIEIGLGTNKGGVDRLKLTYDYGTTDNNGNVKSQMIVVPTVNSVSGFSATQTYSYDPLNRLSAAQETIDGNSNPTWRQVYHYDRFGNRSLIGGPSGTTLPAALNASTNPAIRQADNRIDSQPTTQNRVGYDAAGNLTTDVDNRSFSYDAENLQVNYNGGSQQGGADYSYDGDGRRIKKVTSGNTSIFVYDVMGHLVAEYSNANQTSNGGTSYLTEDILGTPRIITGADGSILARHDYLPFGEELNFDPNRPSVRTAAQVYAGDNVRQKFTAKERDIESGLDYFGARYYSSAQGRFTSPDPSLTSGTIYDPQTWNRYLYTMNNPLRYVDPTGMWEWSTSAGGSATDAQLEAKRKDKSASRKARNDAKKALEFRQRFRDALSGAGELAESKRLNSSQQAKVAAAVNSYGKEGDGNRVRVGFGIQGTGTGANTDGKSAENLIVVTFGPDQKGFTLLSTVAHEGSHVLDNQTYNGQYGGDGLYIDGPDEDVSQYETERRAYEVTSLVAQAHNESLYFSEDKDFQVWDIGWKTAERETKRAKGIDRLLYKRYDISPNDPGWTLGGIKQHAR